MILPRYSIRVILLVTAICAVLSLVISQGLRGKPWAAGMSMGLVALAVSLALGALAFGLTWTFAALLSTLDSRATKLSGGQLSGGQPRASDYQTEGRDKPPVRTPPR
jgi:hypothetical protein